MSRILRIIRDDAVHLEGQNGTTIDMIVDGLKFCWSRHENM